MLSMENLKIKTKFFRGFADSARLSILDCLVDGRKSVTEITRATNMAQPRVSNHLRCLLECGLVRNQRIGKNVYYTIRNEEVITLLNQADRILHDIFQNISYCTRFEEQGNGLDI